MNSATVKLASAARRESLAALLGALAVTCLLGWWFKAHCDPADWASGWQYRSGCYSDAVPFWTARELNLGHFPYFQAPMEYPVLTGLLIGVEGWLTHALFGRGAGPLAFLIVVTGVNAGLAWWVLRRLWAAGLDQFGLWRWACAPPLILYLGHNWDMLAVAFAVEALLAARQGKLATAGAMAGLGTAAKLYPALIVPLLLLQALTAPGAPRERIRAAAIVAAATAGAWLVVNLPVALAAPANWSQFYRFSGVRAGSLASVWMLLEATGWWVTSIPLRNVLASGLFVAGAAAIVALGWRRHRAHPWVLFTPLLAWFMLTNKVYSPQYDLWLYPMLLMTAPRRWPIAWFVVAGIAAYFAELGVLGGLVGGTATATLPELAAGAALRAAAMLVLIADAIQRDAPAWLGLRFSEAETGRHRAAPPPRPRETTHCLPE